MLPENKHPNGFTLIELLIVIAIIAILAAILFPVFASARAKAKQATCQSNLKQIGYAILQYSQDNDENNPYAENDGGGNSYAATNAGTQAWDSLIKPYIGQAVKADQSPQTVFTCPSDDVPRTTPQGQNANLRSYSMVGGLGDQFVQLRVAEAPSGSGHYFYACQPMSKIPQPAQTFMVAEWPNYNNMVSGNSGAIVARPQTVQSGGSGPFGQDATDWNGSIATTGSSSSPTPTQAPVHSNGWNYLFVDGHVKWYMPQATIGTGTTCTMTAPCGYWTLDGKAVASSNP